ncbi:MAG: malto-oligosyltrehalose synthase [Bryobacteraceae bacterium]
MKQFRAPGATYRIQFSRDLRFIDARELVPYLQELGITDLYASPRFRARRGSSHGYDVANPMRINSELGTDEEFDELARRLKDYGMGLVLDIVPNHMAASGENPWWMDVLENGPSSAYSIFFDINWRPWVNKAPFLQENKVLLPILGDLYGRVLENGEFNLKLDENGFYVRYYDHRLPLDPKSYGPILECVRARCKEQGGSQANSFLRKLRELLHAVGELPVYTVSESPDIERRRRDKDVIKRNIWRLYLGETSFRELVDECLLHLNGNREEHGSFDTLDTLLSVQPYRLAYWKIGIEEINYRRFFDINDLVSLRVELPEVFEARHAQVLQLADDGSISGLRIDHIDGLHDPAGYLRRVHGRISENSRRNGFYLIVEKILTGREELPEDWAAAGTTGYDFLNALNLVFVEAAGFERMEEIYRNFTGCNKSFDELCYSRKKLVIDRLFSGDLNALGYSLGNLAAQDRCARDLPLSELVQALLEVTAQLRVYRTYIRSFEIAPQDRERIESALERARARVPDDKCNPDAFDFLRRVLLLDPPSYAAERKDDWLGFVMSWQQFTGPVMAKGLEDTASYIHNSLVSLNDVGGDPERSRACGDLAEFHEFNRRIGERWPHTLSATSTHDTKRSEDVRARINVLSEMPDAWSERLSRWSEWNRPKNRGAPDPNEEILLYQTLLGAWPLDDPEASGIQERVKNYMIKAVREAKRNTNWHAPNEAYETNLSEFVDAILADERFLKDFLDFQGKIAWLGALNSLSQVLLKITSPGVPDFYQGLEIWDFSLVDPDNRRAVDFAKREILLDELRARELDDRPALLDEIQSNWRDGRIKLYLTYRALNFRRNHAQLFANGTYIPLTVKGCRAENVCAFARCHENTWAITVAPRWYSRLAGEEAWQDTHIVLPEGAPDRWENTLTGTETGLELRETLAGFPVALLFATAQSR